MPLEVAAKEEAGAKEAKSKKQTGLNAIFTLLKSNFNVDFSHYKETHVLGKNYLNINRFLKNRGTCK
jgi:hypothetical protein